MKKKKLVIGLFILFICLLSLTIYTSFSSNIDKQEIVIKSMVPVYDETSTIEVDNNNVVFNDKNQVVKYNIVLENTQDYDVKISDIKLSTPTEEFLDYKVEGINKDDVLGANSTKELTISFETMGIKGWGRNFADELTANISFEKVSKQEEIPPVEEDKNEERQPEAPATNTEELISKTEKIEIIRVTKDTIEFKETPKLEKGDKIAVWLYSDPVFLGYFDVIETNGIKQIVGLEEALKKTSPEVGDHNLVLVSEDQETIGYVSIYINENKELLMEKPTETTKDEIKEEVKEGTDNKDESAKAEEEKIENPYTSDKKLVGILGIATCITGLAIMVVSKNKFVKYTVFVLMLSPAFTITNAEEVIEVQIKNNVSFESQNVMKPSYTLADDGTTVRQDYWAYAMQIKNFYIKNEITEIDEYAYEFDVTSEQNGRVMAYLVDNTDNAVCWDKEGYESSCYDLHLMADGIIYANQNASHYFASMINVAIIDNIGGLDTSNVTNMSYMFNSTGRESANLTLNLSNFDTSNVTNMSHMFSEAGLTSMVFALDLSGFDTSEVTDMNFMFDRAGEYSATFNLDVSNFDTSKVINMENMFHRTGYNSEVLALDVSNFDTSNVTNMRHMFELTGYKSTKLNTQITIRNPDLYETRICEEEGTEYEHCYTTIGYENVFYGVAGNNGSQITVNYTSKTSELVDKMVATAKDVCLNEYEYEDENGHWHVACKEKVYPNVVKGELVEIITDDVDVGDELAIGNEHFNVISQTDDTITMLAQYNLGTDYRQSSSLNVVRFADTNGWEYTPGPKEIDIQTWTTNPKTYVNAYVEYLKEQLGDDTATGDLITLKDLEALGCTVPADYAWVSGEWDCDNSPYGWIANAQWWWTRSADSADSYFVWIVNTDGSLADDTYDDFIGVRPVITISKDTLKKLNS